VSFAEKATPAAWSELLDFIVERAGAEILARASNATGSHGHAPATPVDRKDDDSP
jgi:hypothetical protein